MTDFVRARSEEQKQARMAEIKAAADSLFNSVPYPVHDRRKAVMDTRQPLQICDDKGRDLSGNLFR